MELTEGQLALHRRLLIGLGAAARQDWDRHGPIFLVAVAMSGGGPAWMGDTLGAFGATAIIDERGKLRTNYYHPGEKLPQPAYSLGDVDAVATRLAGACDALRFSQVEVEEVFSWFRKWITHDDRQAAAIPRELIDKDKRT